MHRFGIETHQTTMKFLILFFLFLGAQCGYPVAQGSYPTAPDSYVVPKQGSYPTAPGAYATKHSYGGHTAVEVGGAPPQAPPPPPPPKPSGYSSDDQSVDVAGSPPSPPTDSQVQNSPSLSSTYGGGSSPTYGGSLSSGGIVGGNSLNYGTYKETTASTDSAVGGGAQSGYRRRAKAKARARARARTAVNRRFKQRRHLQPIRRFHKFHKKARQ
ncbi:hypothetical protein B9Z55_017084 [Caenorhabditis nigoni]|uniref:DUF4794 domain-containing protein n=2 Tax=Caenorhabditis nigoni TaxID=1611254 RepID=A0A2G5T7H4_9PELO|nr:hypothetical protein B9Z55_017084 [Caenorhabditis nigoni]